MTFIVSLALWLFVFALVLYIIYTAINPNGLIQKSDAFYKDHPRICVALAIFICAVVLYVAHRADAQNDSDIRLRLFTNSYRGMT